MIFSWAFLFPVPMVVFEVIGRPLVGLCPSLHDRGRAESGGRLCVQTYPWCCRPVRRTNRCSTFPPPIGRLSPRPARSFFLCILCRKMCCGASAMDCFLPLVRPARDGDQSTDLCARRMAANVWAALFLDMIACWPGGGTGNALPALPVREMAHNMLESRD